MLRIMLETQEAFQERLGYELSNMTEKERTDYIKEHSIHLTQELHEMLYELPFFKPWKNYDNISFKDMHTKAKEEFIDMWHFMLNIALALGLSADDIYLQYLKKNNINITRQKEGY